MSTLSSTSYLIRRFLCCVTLLHPLAHLHNKALSEKNHQYQDAHFHLKYYKYYCIIIKQRMSLKYHHFRVVFTLHRINISVKFPCAVSTMLKADGKEVQIHSEEKLVQGRANIQTSAFVDVRLTYNVKSKGYSEKKVSLVVYLKSSSGKIPAGSATIIIKSNHEHNNVAVGIEKCPDKAAKIFYSMKLELLNDQDCFEDSLAARSSSHLLSHEHNHVSQAPRNTSRKGLKSELHGSRVSAHRNVVDDKSDRSDTNSQHSRLSRLIMKEHESQVNSQRQKILDLEKDKAKAMREIRTLKQQLQSHQLRKSSVDEKEENYFNTKRETNISILEDQLDSLKNKISDYQSQIHLKKLKMQEIQKDARAYHRKNEQLEEQMKSILVQKQKLNSRKKQIQFQLKDAKQKYEDHALMHENYMKRMEFKENAYKQQIKTLNQKYTSSESQKQRLLFEKNQLINDHDERQRKDKLNWRDRQRSVTQEKNRLIKKVDSLEKQINMRKEQKESLQSELKDKENENKKLKLMIENYEMNIEELRKQNSDFKNLRQKDQIFKKNLQEKLEKNEKITDQKRTLKRNLNQKDHQLSQQLKLVGNLEQVKKNLTKKSDELELALKQKTAAHKILQKEFENLNKKFEALKKAEQNKSQQLSDITFMKQNQESKVSHLNDELKEIEKKYKKTEKQLRKELQQKQNKIFEFDAQLNEGNEKNFILNQKVFEIQRQLEQLKGAFQTKLDQIETLQSEIMSLETKNHDLEAKNTELVNIQKEIDQNHVNYVQKSNNQIAQIEKVNADYEKRIKAMYEESQEEISRLNLLNKNLQNQVKMKEKEIFKLQDELVDEESKKIEANALGEELDHQIKLKGQQIQFLKDTVDKNRQDFTDLQVELKQYRVELQVSERKMKELNDIIEKLKRQKEDINQSERKLSNQFDRYRKDNVDQLKSFFQILNASDVNDVMNIIHEEKEVVGLMIESIKKKRAIHKNSEDTFGDLNREIKELKKQLAKSEEQVQNQNLANEKCQSEILQMNVKSATLERQKNQTIQSLERVIKEEKEKNIELSQEIKSLESGGNNLNSIIKEKIEQVQYLNAQNQELNNMIHSLEEKTELMNKQHEEELHSLINSTNQTVKELNNHIQNLKCNIVEEEKKIIELSEKNTGSGDLITELRLQNKKLEQNVMQSKTEILQLEKYTEKLEKQLSDKQKQISEYQAMNSQGLHKLSTAQNDIKHFQQTINNLETLNKKMKQNIRDLEDKNKNQLQIQREKGHELFQKTNKLNTDISKLNRQIASEKAKNEQLDTMKKNLQGKISDYEGMIKDLKKQQDSLNKKITSITQETTSEKNRFLKENEQAVKKLEKELKLKSDQVEELKQSLKKVKSQKQHLEKSAAEKDKSLDHLKSASTHESAEMTKKLSFLQYQKKENLAELSKTKQQLKTIQQNLSQLSKKYEEFQLSNDTEANYLQPIMDKIKQISRECKEYTKFMSQYETNKNKLLKLSSHKIENYGEKFIGDAVRQLNIAFQKCKTNIINKFKLSQDDKIAIVNEFKSFQHAIEKISLNC